MAMDIAGFKNPKGYWRHEGQFSIEFVEGVDHLLLASRDRNLVVRGKSITVKNGILGQDANWVQFSVHEEGDITSQPTSMWTRYMHEVKAIRDGEGELLWVNGDQS